MARLSKQKFQDTSRFTFTEREVEFAGDQVLIRSPLTLEQRDQILGEIKGRFEARQVELTARIFGVAVVIPTSRSRRRGASSPTIPAPSSTSSSSGSRMFNELLGIKADEEAEAVQADEFPGRSGDQVPIPVGGEAVSDGPGTSGDVGD